jgi:Flp pilus assembly CpaF family ATPase
MELKDKVVLNKDDIRMVLDFFQHYNDPKVNNLILTDRLKNEIESFQAKVDSGSYTTEDQRRFTIALCGALSATTHPLLRDDAIKDVINACDAVYVDAMFYEEFENPTQDLSE